MDGGPEDIDPSQRAAMRAQVRRIHQRAVLAAAAVTALAMLR
jgi:hypothetical protein